MARRGAVRGMQITGLNEVIAELQKRGLDVRQGLTAICDAGAQVVEAEIAERAPGRLAESTMRETRDRAPTKVSVAVGFRRQESYIARFLEFGTKPHVIAVRPRKRGSKKALYFGGRFARRVQHPGLTKRPFVRPGFDAASGDAADAMGRKTKDVIRA